MRIDSTTAFTTAETTLEPGAGRTAGHAGDADVAEATGASALPEDTAVFSPAAETSASRAGQSVEQLAAQAMAPDADRAGRVDSLRSAVTGGSYSVDPSAIADAMVG